MRFPGLTSRWTIPAPWAAPQPLVDGLVDHPHPALAEALQQAVVRDALARRFDRRHQGPPRKFEVRRRAYPESRSDQKAGRTVAPASRKALHFASISRAAK